MTRTRSDVTGDDLEAGFEHHRRRLYAMAYRMLGAHSDAEDALQEAWIRLDRSRSAPIENLGGWLTTVTSRVCLNVLRSRRTRREIALESHVGDPVVRAADAADTEDDAILADSVGRALLVVLDFMSPPERLAFVLHDIFALRFDEIAEILGRSPEAARQLASRARRRAEHATVPDPTPARQREVVDAFFAAARHGDLDALVAVLHPDVVLRSDGGATRPDASAIVRGARGVAERASAFADPTATLRPAVVNGATGVVVVTTGGPIAVMAFTVAAGRIVAIDVLADPARLRHLSLGELAQPAGAGRPT